MGSDETHTRTKQRVKSSLRIHHTKTPPLWVLTPKQIPSIYLKPPLEFYALSSQRIREKSSVLRKWEAFLDQKASNPRKSKTLTLTLEFLDFDWWRLHEWWSGRGSLHESEAAQGSMALVIVSSIPSFSFRRCSLSSSPRCRRRRGMVLPLRRLTPLEISSYRWFFFVCFGFRLVLIW